MRTGGHTQADHPSDGRQLNNDLALTNEIRAYSSQHLQLQFDEVMPEEVQTASLADAL